MNPGVINSPTMVILRRAGIAGLLCGLCWFAHFSGYRQLGFYEDDHAFAAEVLTWTPRDAALDAWNQLRWFPMPQGRPVGFILGRLLPYLGWKCGGLPGMYLIGWMILSANSILLFELMRRCLPSPMPIIVAIGFVFFPADTTRPFLCHAHILQPAVMFTLIACHLNLSRGWRGWGLAYLFLLLALLTYETAMLPLVAFPLLHRRYNLLWLKRFGLHLVLIVSLVGLLAAARRVGGEERVVTAGSSIRSDWDLIKRGTPIGIRTSVHLCRLRAIQGLKDFLAHIQPRIRTNMLAAGITLFAAVVLAYGLAPAGDRPRHSGQLLLDLLRAAAFGLAGLSMAYVFCFTHFPPDYELGRLTSTHLAATLPLAVLFAVITSLPMLLPPPRLSIVFTAGAAGLYFMLLYAASSDEQVGYIALWNARRDFWTQALALCPDLSDRTLIVADNQIHRPSYYMDSSSWSEYMVLPQCYDFPSTMARKPMAFCFRPGDDGSTWQSGAIVTADGKIGWKPNPFGPVHDAAQAVQDGNLILLHIDPTGRVTRVTGTVQLAGQTVRLKPLPPPGQGCAYPRLPLYSLLTRPGRF